MKRLIWAILGVAALVGGVFYYLDHRPAKRLGASDQLRVVTTNSILEDMVREVGGPDVALTSIVSRGTDPHEYEPRPSDITAAAEADVIFHNGLNLETGGNGWFTKLVETAHKQFDEDVFAASATVAPRYLTTDPTQDDPHAWLDIANGIRYVRVITKVLKQKDPRHAAAYQRRSTAYIAKLTRLHEAAQAKFAQLPTNQRVLVTSEGAFKYFGHAYGVKPVYIWEINTEAQGTPAQMQAVLGQIRANQVRHLFVETSVSPKAMNKVASESGLSIAATLFTDSLAAAGKTGDTYYTMMKWNLDRIYAGLQ